jgi:hypothetical protein
MASDSLDEQLVKQTIAEDDHDDYENAMDYTIFELEKADNKALPKYGTALQWTKTSSYQRYQPLEIFLICRVSFSTEVPQPGVRNDM